MACHLFGDKPVPEPIPSYKNLDPSEQNSEWLEASCKTLLSRTSIQK